MHVFPLYFFTQMERTPLDLHKCAWKDINPIYIIILLIKVYFKESYGFSKYMQYAFNKDENGSFNEIFGCENKFQSSSIHHTLKTTSDLPSSLTVTLPSGSGLFCWLQSSKNKSRFTKPLRIHWEIRKRVNRFILLLSGLKWRMMLPTHSPLHFSRRFWTGRPPSLAWTVRRWR